MKDTPTTPERPRFEHDCESCVFLGRYTRPVADGTGNRRHPPRDHDLYYCAGAHDPTVIARYGSDGPEYASGMEIARAFLTDQPDSELSEALRRAQARGLAL
jgi:hypothetical protein